MGGELQQQKTAAESMKPNGSLEKLTQIYTQMDYGEGGGFQLLIRNDLFYRGEKDQSTIKLYSKKQYNPDNMNKFPEIQNSQDKLMKKQDTELDYRQ